VAFKITFDISSPSWRISVSVETRSTGIMIQELMIKLGYRAFIVPVGCEINAN
jgi:hypothetical protein